ncbi:hypothetical protein T11_10452 [Trichinella zimbabwensis]|uniref:Uncharacterized protein n=1 Tax=Trichinella zimbabwensis TaxID=268475 RepID=A0A0V1GH36_9BILA|nr:hypothetical protein T11_10452 [Trichinella zimbabwensis]
MDRKAAFEEKLRALIKEKGQNAAIFPTTQIKCMTFCESSQMVQNLFYGVLKISEENQLIRLGKNDAIRCITFTK